MEYNIQNYRFNQKEKRKLWKLDILTIVQQQE